MRKNYKKTFFNFVDPKVVITLMSSHITFYKLKSQFPKITTISIQCNPGDPDFMKFIKNAKKDLFPVIIFFSFRTHLNVFIKNIF